MGPLRHVRQGSLTTKTEHVPVHVKELINIPSIAVSLPYQNMLADERLCDSAMPPPRPTRRQLNPLLRETVPRLSIHRAHLGPLSTTWPLTSQRESDNGRRGGKFFFFFCLTPLCPFESNVAAWEQRKCFESLSPGYMCSSGLCSNPTKPSSVSCCFSSLTVATSVFDKQYVWICM